MCRIADSAAQALHRRSILWRVRDANRPPHHLITRLSVEGRRKIRIHSLDVLAPYIHPGWCKKAEMNLVAGFLKPGMMFYKFAANVYQYTLLAAGLLPREHQDTRCNVGKNELRFLREFDLKCSRCIIRGVWH